MRHDVVADRLAEAMRALAGPRLRLVRGVGVAVGGIVDTRTGDIVRVDLLPGLNGLNIGPVLAEDLGVPTHVDNDARAQALGDLLFGLGRGYATFSSLYVGEGIGAGFILDGTLHRGPGGAGGESGHMTVDRDGPACTCGRTGCWEALAATRWLRAEAAARGLPGARGITVARLSRRAAEEPDCARLLSDYAANVALGVANLQQLLGVGRFIVHGDPVQGGNALRTEIEEEVRARTLAHPASPVDVVFADPDDHATLRGAAAVVLSRALHVSF
jgi:predicted NBD/HSP70 family sugar kinase